MVARTSVSSGSPSARGRARASVLVGLLAVALLPAAYALQREREEVSLLWAGVVAVPCGLLGLVALGLARGVRRRAALSLSPIPGARMARAGRVLGFLAVYGAVTVGLALGFYALLARFGGE